MFKKGFEKIAEYDEKEHFADLMSTDHKHWAKMSPQGYVKPTAIVAGLGAALGALAGAHGDSRTMAIGAGAGALAGAALGAIGAKSINNEIQEAKRTSQMSSEERKSYYRGYLGGMGMR